MAMNFEENYNVEMTEPARELMALLVRIMDTNERLLTLIERLGSTPYILKAVPRKENE